MAEGTANGTGSAAVKRQLVYRADWSALKLKDAGDGWRRFETDIVPSSDAGRQTARSRLDLLEKRVERAQRDARKYGFPEPRLDVGAPKFVSVDGGCYEAIPVAIEFKVDLRCGEWDIAAILHHNELEEGKNLVEFFPKYHDAIPLKYHQAECWCDECAPPILHPATGDPILHPVTGDPLRTSAPSGKPTRTRHTTAVLQNVNSGQFAQFGTTCFSKPFFGAAGGNIAAMLRFFRRIVKLVSDDEIHKAPSRPIVEGISTDRYFQYAAAEMARAGYRRGTTAGQALAHMNADIVDARRNMARKYEPTDIDRENGRAALAWAANLDVNESVAPRIRNWRQNAVNLASGAFIPLTRESRGLGFACEIIDTYRRFRQTERRKEAVVETPSTYFLEQGSWFGQDPSLYAGSAPGIPMTVDSIMTKDYSNGRGRRSSAWSIVHFRTIDGGNLAIWKGSEVTPQIQALGMKEGDRLVLAGRVKATTLYLAVPQSELDNVRVLARYDEAPAALLGTPVEATPRTTAPVSDDDFLPGQGGKRIEDEDIRSAEWSERGAMLEMD